MFERIIEQQKSLCATSLEVHKADLMPSDVELSTLEAFLSVMRPLVEIMDVKSGSLSEW